MENGTQNTGGVPNVGSRSNAASTPFDVQTSQPTQASTPATVQVSPYLSTSQNPPVSVPAAPPVAQTRPPRAVQRGWLNRKTLILIVLLLIVVGGALLAWRSFNSSGPLNNSENSNRNAAAFGTLNIPLGGLAQNGQLSFDPSRSLNINGQLKVNSGFVIAPSDKPTSGVAGQMYYDRNTNELSYYNGNGFVSLTSNPQTVTSINGVAGTLTLGSGLSLNGSQLSNSGIVSITSASSNLAVANDGSGNITLSAAAAPSGVQSQNGTAGSIAVFTGTSTIADSLLSQSGDTLNVDGGVNVVGAASINGGATISGTLNLQQNGTETINIADATSGVTGQIFNDGNLHVTGGTNNLWLDAGGSGTVFINAANNNPVAINEATIPSYPLEVNGDINITAGHSYRIGGTVICSISGCTSSGGGGSVTSLNGLSGALTLANATGSGTTVTINDASTTQKGIAQFNSTNFSVSSGNVNTIQNIDPTATPTFAGLNTNAITPSAALTVGSASQSATLQGSTVLVKQSNGGNTATLTFAAPTANVTYRLQTAAAGTYDVCTTAGNCTGVGGGVTTTGGTTNKLAKFTGAQAIGDSLISDNGTLVTVGGDLRVTGTVSLTNALSVTNGGTGAIAAPTARTNLGAAASGSNSDITSLSGLTTALSVTQGGTGAASLTANGVLLGNGTAAISSLAAASANLCLVSTSGAPTWQSCPGSGGVSSVNGLTGALTIANASAAGSTITLNDASTSQKGIAQFNSTNFSVSSGTVNTIQDINTAATPTFGRLSLSSSQATSPMLLANNTNGSGSGNLIDLQLNGSSKFSVAPTGSLTLSGTINGQTISSSANFTGSVAVASTLNVNTITPTGALTVGATGQNITLQGANTSIIATNGANTATLTFVAPTANVTYRLQTAAAGTYDVCTTAGNCTGVGGGVTTTGGTTNHVAKFTGSQAVGNSIITDDGSTVTIGGTLSANTITPTGALSIGSTSQNITLLGAVTTLSSTSSGITNSLTFATPGASNKTITVPNANGTVAVSASGPLSLDASGNLTCPSCVTSGGGGGGQSAVDSLDGLTGTLTLNNASGSGTTVTINDASTSQKGIAQFNSTNFTASAGVVNTVQDINTTATPSFGRLIVTSSQASNDMLLVNNTNASGTGSLLKLQLNGGNKFTVDGSGNVVTAGTITSGTINGQTISSSANFTGSVAVASTLNVNTITPTGALTVGATGQSLTLQGSTTSLSATNSGSTTTLNFQTPTANVTYRLLTAAAGTYDICTTAGNCTGVGGGVTTTGGTANTIAKFTGSQTLGNSDITDNGSAVGIAVNLNVNTITPTGAMTIGATGQNLTLQGATVNLTATSGGITNSLTFATPSGSNKTITVPNASGTVVVSASGPLSIDTAGNITCPSCATGSNVSSLNSLTGALSIANATGSGSTITLNDASTSQKGIAQFNSTNFSASGGVINTVQDINTTAAPTFGRLTVTSSQASNDMLVVNNTNASGTGDLLRLQLNGGDKFTVDPSGNVVAAGTITSGTINGQTISSSANFTGSVAIGSVLNVNSIVNSAPLTIGSTSFTSNIQGAFVNLITNNSGKTNTLVVQQATTGNITYRLLNTTPGTYDICTTAGNCSTGSLQSAYNNGNTITTTDSRDVVFNMAATTTDSNFLVNLQCTTSCGSNGRFAIQNGGTDVLSVTPNSGAVTLHNASDSAAALLIQNAAGRNIVAVSTSASTLTLGNITATSGQGVAGSLVLADGTNDNFGLTLNTTTLTANRTISLPNEVGTICLQNSSNCGFALSSGSGNYIQNQNASDQTGNFRITGTGRANTSLLTPLLDTPSAATLAIGTTNATGISLNQNTTLASGKSLTIQGGVTVQNPTDGTSTFNIATSTGNNIFTVDTQNGRVGINLGSGNTPTLTNGGLEVKGSLRLSGNAGSVDTFVTPGGAHLDTKINIPLYDIANFSQILAMGVTSTSSSSSRGILVADARTSSHQPTIAVLSPDEANIVGFSWEGSSSTAYLKTTGTNLAFRSNTTDIMTLLSGGNVGIGTSPSYKLDTAGDVNTSTQYRIGGTTICTSSGCTAASGSSSYIQNQSAADQSADFRISGTARANTAVQTPNLDTATSTGLLIGSANASSVTIGNASSSILTTIDGSTLVKAVSDNASEFQIQNASSVSQFNVDTSASKITIGPSGGNTTGTILVLGTKTNSGDPTGVEGAMYYNASMKRMRCYYDGQWRFCNDPTGLTWGYNIAEDFIGPSGGGGLVGSYGWSSTTVGTGGNTGIAPDVSYRPGQIQLFTGTGTSASTPPYSWLWLNTGSANPVVVDGGMEMEMAVNIPALATGTDDYYASFGLCDNLASPSTDCNNGLTFEYKRDTSTNWIMATSSGGARTKTTSSTAVTTGWHRLKAAVNSAGNSISYYVDGNLIGSVSTNIPTASTQPSFFIGKNVSGSGGSSTNMTLRIDYFQLHNTLTTPR